MGLRSMRALSPLQRATALPKGPEKKKLSVKIGPRTIKALDGFGTHLALLAFGFMQDRAETAMPLFSLFSGGTAHGCTEDDDYDVDDVEVLKLVSLIDSRRRPEGSSGARCKTTGARAEARAVGTTQPLDPKCPSATSATVCVDHCSIRCLSCVLR